MEASPEQIAAMQEKLKNMSPEELREYQKQNCIFCQIISGKVQSKKIYDDEKVLGILDINPATKGHVLLMPKEHFPIMPMMPAELINHLFRVAKKISKAALKGLKARGTTIFIANGGSAGQRAQHFMLHVIPRFELDGADKLNIPEKNISLEDIKNVMKKLGIQNLGVKEQRDIIENKPKKKTEKQPTKKSTTKKETKTSKKDKEANKAIDSKNGVNLDEIADLLS